MSRAVAVKNELERVRLLRERIKAFDSQPIAGEIVPDDEPPNLETSSDAEMHDSLRGLIGLTEKLLQRGTWSAINRATVIRAAVARAYERFEVAGDTGDPSSTLCAAKSHVFLKETMTWEHAAGFLVVARFS